MLVINNIGQKIYGTKFSPTRPGGESGEISGYIIISLSIKYNVILFNAGSLTSAQEVITSCIFRSWASPALTWLM